MFKQIIEEARAGDPRATEQVVESLRPAIARAASHFARRTGCDADDLQQEMWVGVMLGLREVDTRIGDPFAYLYQRGRWYLFGALRRMKRQAHLQLGDTEAALTAPGFESGVWAREEQSRWRGALNPRQQVIFDALALGYRQEEVARRLGCTGANVSYHLRQIRSLCRAEQ